MDYMIPIDYASIIEWFIQFIVSFRSRIVRFLLFKKRLVWVCLKGLCIVFISIHLCVTLQHVPVVEDFLKDLWDSVQIVSHFTIFLQVRLMALCTNQFNRVWLLFSISGKRKPRSNKWRTCSNIWCCWEDAW